MNNTGILDLLRWLSLALAFGAFLYKYCAFTTLRKNHLYVPFRVISFYSGEQIHSTTTGKKRDFMRRSNWTTRIMYACLLPHIAILVAQLLMKIKDLLDGIF